METELHDFIPFIAIQHVGSTSIQGLCAKPILDIDIILDNKEHLKEITARLEKIGYRSKGDQGIPGRFAFRQRSGMTPFTRSKRIWQSHHLYVCYTDSLALKNHILFRDALRNNKELLEKYAEFKKTLVSNLKITREDYAKRKTDFIVAVLATSGLSKNELTSIRKANS